jgi:hypothetical protein
MVHFMKSNLLILFSILAVSLTHQLHAEVPLAEGTAAEKASKEWEIVMNAVEEGRHIGGSKREIAKVYLWGAGRCRDIGAQDETLKLFDLALKEDPTYPRSYRVYADYLFGYRGQYEEAAYLYYKARELIEKQAEEVKSAPKADAAAAVPLQFEEDIEEGKRPEEQFVAADEEADSVENLTRSLDRSMQILHRDGGDGVPLFTSANFSAFLESFYEFRELSVGHGTFDSTSLYESQLRAEELAQRLGTLTGNFTKPRYGQEVAKNLNTRLDEQVYGGKLKFRFGNPNIPYFQITGQQSHSDDGAILNSEIYLPDLANPPLKYYNSRVHYFEGLIGKNLILLDDLTLNLEGKLSKQEVKVFDPFRRDAIIEKERTNKFDLDAKLVYSLETDSLTISAGGSAGDITNLSSDGDSLNQQRLSLRWSNYATSNYLFPRVILGSNPTRFQGRRSTHYEIGVRRTDRSYENATVQESYEPLGSLEFLGLFDGYFDLTFVQRNLFRQYTSGTIKGDYQTHSVEVIPTYVAIYRLYDEDFKTGFESLNFSMPTRYTWGSGEFDRVNTGLQVSTSWQVIEGFRIDPSLLLDYAHFTHLNTSDWGIYGKLNIRY